jgi:hypothetical protein
LGDEPSHLLEALLVSGIYGAAQRRGFNSTAFRIVADEFQNFATHAFTDILSEARKYGLSLTLAHQYLDQILIGQIPDPRERNTSPSRYPSPSPSAGQIGSQPALDEGQLHTRVDCCYVRPMGDALGIAVFIFIVIAVALANLRETFIVLMFCAAVAVVFWLIKH